MKKGQYLLPIVLAGVMLFGAGCGSKKQEVSQTLTVSAAASLTDCMEEMRSAFEKEYPNIKLQFNFGASGALQKQIEQGAPADVFFSAGMKQMKALEEANLMQDDSVEEILNNRLVLIVPSGQSQDLTFAGLKDADIDKIAVGEVESVPVGQYTMEVFDALGLMPIVESHLVYAKDVREVLSWVETGNADAGIVYETDAVISDKVIISDRADESWHKPITYPVGIVKSTSHEEVAKDFLKFIKSEEGKAIFERYGFSTKF